MFNHLQHSFQLVCLLTFLFKNYVLDVIRINILASLSILAIFQGACDISSFDFFKFIILFHFVCHRHTFLIWKCFMYICILQSLHEQVLRKQLIGFKLMLIACVFRSSRHQNTSLQIICLKYMQFRTLHRFYAYEKLFMMDK